MVDANIITRNWLIDPTGPVRALLGNADRVYVGVLPEGFSPLVDPGILVNIRGMTAETEMPIIHPSMQISVYAAPDLFDIANVVALAIFDWLQGKFHVDFGTDGHVISCLFEGTTNFVDPDTQWATVVSFYGMILRS